jgi:predicted GIY-YIG superfamily endonuclease
MRPAIACIYALTDLADGQMYYVGSTIHFSRRMKQHLYRSAHGDPCYVGKHVS